MIYKNLFLTIEQNRPGVALNFGAFRVEKEVVSLDNKAPKVVSYHLSAPTTNDQCELGTRTVKAGKR